MAGNGNGQPIGIFQSTLPVRGATVLAARGVRQLTNFNPRSP